jgi:DNA-binding beta-propeller fold protein YncE
MTIARSILKVALAATLAMVAGCGSSPSAGTSNPNAAAATASRPGGTFAFWPPAPDEPHIQFVKSFLTFDDVSKRQVSGLEKIVFGREVENGETISKPYGVAMRYGRIYVCDIRNKALTVLDLKAKQTRLVGVSGSVTLRHPVAVAIGDDGSLYVADNELNAIVVFDPGERFVKAIGHDRFKPAGVAVHGNRLYASDMGSQLVECFDIDTGQRIGVIGSVGDEDGQFRLPLGVATDSKGDVYVVDMMRCKVQKFSPEGKFLMSIGAQGDYVGAFVRPKHIAVDSEGIIYVVDAGFQNVQMFDAKGKTLMFFGAMGNHPGSMNLPAGIAVADDDLEVLDGLVHPGFKARRTVVVTNQFGPNRVALYAMGGLREGHTVAELSKSAASMVSGVSVPDADRLHFQNPGALPTEPPQSPAPPLTPAGPVSPK